MNRFSNSIILIGMPGAGKSTIGVMLAKTLAKDFIDTDLLIQLQAGKTLQDIVNAEGYLKLRSIEEQVLTGIHFPNHIIATGGSAVYSDKAMQHLQHLGPIVFLDVSLDELSSRIKNIESRGLARKPNQSLAELYDERRALYQKYASITIDCNGKTQDDILEQIIYAEAEAFTEKDA